MRITVAIIGWLLTLALSIGIAGPLFGTCTQGDDKPWISSVIFFAPIGLIGLALAAVGAKLGRWFCWLAIPHILTVALGCYLIPRYFIYTTLGGQNVCFVREGSNADLSASLLQRLWAPAWFIMLALLVWVIVSYWRGYNGDLRN